jgi:hypothetical protein
MNKNNIVAAGNTIFIIFELFFSASSLGNLAHFGGNASQI